VIEIIEQYPFEERERAFAMARVYGKPS